MIRLYGQDLGTSTICSWSRSSYCPPFCRSAFPYIFSCFISFSSSRNCTRKFGLFLIFLMCLRSLPQFSLALFDYSPLDRFLPDFAPPCYFFLAFYSFSSFSFFYGSFFFFKQEQSPPLLFSSSLPTVSSVGLIGSLCFPELMVIILLQYYNDNILLWFYFIYYIFLMSKMG